jgi:hypothetical protein
MIMRVKIKLQAKNIADAHLKSLIVERPNEWNDIRIDENRSIYSSIWWYDYIELHEVPYTDSTGNPRGYALVSLDNRLPPVLEYASDGDVLSGYIAGIIGIQPLPSKQDSNFPRITFITSTEFFAEMTMPDGTTCLFDPIRRKLHSRNQLPIPRVDPTALFDQTIVRQQWADLTRNPGPGDVVVIEDASPVLYNQDCENDRSFCMISLNTPNSPCAPAAIAGCAAVAWAMLASSFKKLGLPESHKIWTGATDWDLNWNSGYPISRSAAVRRSIWLAHKAMNTSVNGETAYGNLINGQEIFREMGIGWVFKSEEYRWYDFYDSCRRRRPAIWSATGPWGSRGLVGHSVVVFGYRHVDTTFRIGLGWGKNRPYINTNYGQYDNFHGEMSDF